jgi:nitrogen fixation NifU-like protein
MTTLSSLYQEIIIDHGNCPRNEGTIGGPTHRAEGYNATCGDELTVTLRVQGDRIEDIKFQAQGCAISRASASMMSEKIRGMSIADSLKFSRNLQKILNGDGQAVLSEDEMGDLVALLGVQQFPMRVKCATLAWHTLENALGSSLTD